MSNVQLPNITDFESAKKYLGSKMERPCGHNTRIQWSTLGHEVITILYHGNSIVSYYPDRISLTNSNWYTITTKERLNHFIPSQFSIWQERGQWFLSNRETQKRYIWANGITIQGNQVYNAGSESDVENTKQLTKRIHKYVKGFVQALVNREVSKPDSGDCWYCLMVTDKGENLGHVTNNHDHLESHFEESYYVPSLLVNAIKEFPVSQIANYYIGVLLGINQDETNNSFESITKEQLTSSLIRYLKHELGIAA